MGCNSTGCCPNNNLFECSLKRFLLINLDEIVKTIFSRKVAKNAKKKSVNFAAFAAWREILNFYEFVNLGERKIFIIKGLDRANHSKADDLTVV